MLPKAQALALLPGYVVLNVERFGVNMWFLLMKSGQRCPLW
ncbi:hypothetical protein AC85_0027 [Escherichia coli 3-020-07_S4_C1]|nr:hypothetical protein AD30_4047 [Escherichia coli 2-316-03_S4_C3]KEJ63224.1 hypothetical protein AC85_0027 [Escherichia coli 3-020-07_S4_C1]